MQKSIKLFVELGLIALLSLALVSVVRVDDTNLALPFQSATPANSNTGWGWWQVSGDVIYSDDSSVEHTVGYPSIKLGWHVDGVDGNIWRELDGKWLNVNAGDHIVFSVWIKTGAGTGGDPGYGGRIGIDLYGQLNGATHNFAWQPQAHETTVPWSSDWTKAIIDVYVPSDIYGSYCPWGPNAVVDGITASDSSSHYILHSSGPYAIIPWMDGRMMSDPHYIWFADAELYVNP